MLTFRTMRRDAAELVASGLAGDGLTAETNQAVGDNRIARAITDDSQFKGLLHFAQMFARRAKDPCPDCNPDRLCDPHRAAELVDEY